MAERAPQKLSSVVIVPGVTIPVVLKKKLDVAKVKEGDIVKMELVEAVAGSGATTIPAGTKVYGQVVGSTRLSQFPESRLAVLIDRIEWKHTVIPIRAVVTGFGAFKVVVNDGQDRMCSDVQSENNVYITLPTADGTTPRRGTATATMLSNAKKGCASPDALGSRTSLSKTKDIVVRRLKARPDISVLISKKKDIVLKSGTLLMLRNLEEAQEVAQDYGNPR